MKRAIKAQIKPEGRKSSHVPGQALGYSLQFTRMTELLLTTPPGTMVSLEVFEDVGEQGPSDGKRLSQTKSALKSNPASDRSPELWKALANWIDAVTQLKLDCSKTIFEFYVSRPVSGNIANSFTAAKTQNDALTALQSARTVMWGPAPTWPERKNMPDSLKPYVERVLAAPNDIVAAVIQSFCLTCGSGSPHSDIEKIIADIQWVPSERILSLATYACGWVKKAADQLLEKQQPSILSRDDFHKDMTLIVRKLVERNILQSFAPQPSSSEQTELQSRPFVKQLELINLSFEDVCSAISDYFRSVHDRTSWGASGEVHPESFTELNQALTRVWKNNNSSIQVQHANLAPPARGQILYSECQKHRHDIEGMQPPDHFVPGCFHDLADSLDVGWHPDYKTLLNKDTDE